MSNYITLPRSELYERVWAKPVTEVAAEFGISDVALAKRCRALNIPLPPRGYWAKVAAGQTPRKPPLPAYRPTRRPADGRIAPSDTPQARPCGLALGSVPRDGPRKQSDHPPSEPLAEPEVTVSFDLNRKTNLPAVADVELPAITATVTTDLASTLAIVKRTARHLKHPRRAELRLARGEGSGPVISIHVSPAQLERALLFADTFLRAAAEQGWHPIPEPTPEPPDPRHYYGRPPEPPKKTGPDFADLAVDGHHIEILIEERFDLKELPPTQAELNRQKRDRWFRPEKRHEKIWSGRLRLKRPGHRYPYGINGKSWFETANRKLGDSLPKILADFKAVAVRMQEVDEERERERLERERQAQLAAELAARRAAHQERIQALETQAGAWHRAQFLRHYLRAARRALGSANVIGNDSGESADFLAWAEHYVNQLDPLHSEPRDPDLAHEHDFYYGAEEKRYAESLQRLLGHAWEHSTKLA